MQTRIEMRLPNEKMAHSIMDALNTNKKINRGEVLIKQIANVLILEISSLDMTAMRSALNSYLRIIDSIINVWEVVENGRSKRH